MFEMVLSSPSQLGQMGTWGEWIEFLIGLKPEQGIKSYPMTRAQMEILHLHAEKRRISSLQKAGL